jgi:hypothetical protein
VCSGLASTTNNKVLPLSAHQNRRKAGSWVWVSQAFFNLMVLQPRGALGEGGSGFRTVCTLFLAYSTVVSGTLTLPEDASFAA